MGPSGCGKTSWAYREWPHLWDFPVQQPKSFWFDTLPKSDVRCLLFDEFWGEVPLPIINRLVDWRAPSLPIKGSFAHWSSLTALECVIICTNARRLADIWQWDERHASLEGTLWRRVRESGGAVCNLWDTDYAGKYRHCDHLPGLPCASCRRLKWLCKVGLAEWEALRAEPPTGLAAQCRLSGGRYIKGYKGIEGRFVPGTPGAPAAGDGGECSLDHTRRGGARIRPSITLVDDG